MKTKIHDRIFNNIHCNWSNYSYQYSRNTNRFSKAETQQENMDIFHHYRKLGAPF